MRFLTIFLTLSQTATANAFGIQQVTLVERWRTTGSATAIEFGTINGMVETRSGQIWIADGLRRQIVALTDDGVVFSTVAREGDQPGEIRSPNLMARDSRGHIYVYNLTRATVEIFDGDGQFRRRVHLNRPFISPKGLVVDRSRNIIISAGLGSSDHAIFSFDPDGHPLAEWYPNPSPAANTSESRVAVGYLTGGPLSLTRSGNLLFSAAAEHHIVAFGSDDTVGTILAREPTLIPPVIDEFFAEHREGPQRVRTPRWFSTRSSSIHELPNGMIMNVINREADDWTRKDESVWELYDRKGLVSRTTINLGYRVWSMTRDGDLLASHVDPDTGKHWAVRLMVNVR